MTNRTQKAHAAPTAKLATRPIGSAKAAKFSSVEGLVMNAESLALSRRMEADGLTGDAYRAAITKAFKKS